MSRIAVDTRTLEEAALLLDRLAARVGSVGADLGRRSDVLGLARPRPAAAFARLAEAAGTEVGEISSYLAALGRLAQGAGDGYRATEASLT